MIVFQVFNSIILPIAIIVAIGSVLKLWKKTPSDGISQTVLYIFSPALVFTGIGSSSMPLGKISEIVFFTLLLTIIMFVISRIISLILKLDDATKSAFILCVIFMNSGNLGLSLVLLTFGQQALDQSLVFFSTQAMLNSTIGIYIASRGTQGITESLKAVAKQPLLYAAILGFVVNALGITPIEPLQQSTKMLAEATIPCMLIVLGFQLSNQIRINNLGTILIAVFLRLVVCTLVSIPLLQMFGFSDISRNAILIQASTPPAVVITILTNEFNSRPDFAANTVVIGTLLGLPTLTGLLAILSN